MTIKTVAVVAALSMTLAGCAIEPMTATPDTLSGYQGKPLTVVTYNTKDGFLQMTAGTAMFATIGALVAISESNKLVIKYDLINPSSHTAEKLTPVLIERLKPQSVTPLADISDGSKSLTELAALSGNKGLVFDVQTQVWMSYYFPMDWTHYRLMYMAVGRLVDGNTRKLVAQAPCKIEPAYDKNAPSYDELYANNAALLKSDFQKEADNCADQMAKVLFGGQ